MKFISIVGTRPNIIKLAPMHQAITDNGHEHVILHTGQHYDDNMSSNLFKELKLPEPDYNLGLGSGWLSQQFASGVCPIADILNAENPDMTLIYGDVVSSLAGAIASVQNHHPIAHIEAGIRNNSMLITEHFNRIIIDRIAQLNFCVSQTDYENLQAEDLGRTAHIVGDVMKDLSLTAPMPKGNRETGHILLTLHRPENVDDPKKFHRILQALEKIGRKVVWPIHPRSRHALAKLGVTPNGKIELIEPQSYTEMTVLLRDCSMVITDSGGLQKEAYWAHKPCIVVYDDIVWPEIFETGNQCIVRDNFEDIPELVREFSGSIKHPTLFGAGDASQRIVKIIEDTDLNEIFRQ